MLKNPEIALAQTNLPSISQTESAIACESIVRSTSSEVATDIVEQVVDEVDSSIQRSENAIVEKFFKCNDCGINAISEKQLETHKRIKHGEVANFEYDDCQFLCNDKRQLETHIKTKHSNSGSFVCILCQFIGKDKEDLAKHVRDSHKVNVY